MSDAEISFVSRIWLSWLVYFRVLFDGAFAAKVARVAEGKEPAALPEAPEEAPKPEPVKKKKPEPTEPDLTPALQLLALLQREGRFVDFLKEDVSGFADADIGAAARVVHDGCRRVLEAHATLEPVRTEEEGTSLEIEGARADVKLTGAVEGKGPYKGTLTHKGWRCKELRLPTAVEGHDPRVIAQAELEL